MSGDGAVFKGLAIAGPMLYATDFANACVDVFDSTFAPMSTPGAFTDSHIPSDYAPFGIQTIGDHVFVTYAKQDEDEDEAARVRPGLRRRVHDHGRPRPPRRKPRRADRPLGPAAAPDNFGALGGDLLVGNFGDGRINAYTPSDDGFEREDALRGAGNRPLAIDGLWALEFGLGGLANNGPTDTLFFTAGPDDESQGPLGTIRAG